MSRRITRRQALGQTLAGTALLAAACGRSGGLRPDPFGSTLRTTYRDPQGTGFLVPGSGEPLRVRTELGPPAPAVGVLATVAHLTDAHVLDAQSPARVTFLDRLGSPFESTFRPHETLTAQVLDGALRAVGALRPDRLIEGGDLIDNDQANELTIALTVLAGGMTRSDSGPPGYFGVQSSFNPDPFYYRPELDAPRHPVLLRAATRAFFSRGAGVRWHPVLGDHDILVAGEVAPTPGTRGLALGDRAVWELPPGLTAPRGLISGPGGPGADGFSPDGPPYPGLVDRFLAVALNAPKVRVPPDCARRQLDAAEAVGRLGLASGQGGRDGRLDYSTDIRDHVRLLVLDLARRGGGSGGLVRPGQLEWLAHELARAGDRWILVASHQPLTSSEGGGAILALLDRHPRVVAALSGHIHRNRIVPRATAAGGYWLISTASLIDYPQQARALRLLATADQGVAIQTWMLDHAYPGTLGTISRQLAYLDAQGGRPQGFIGGRLDRNVTLYRAGVRK
ncbi:MAG: metallophosphoesterase family protein [Solirubrobacteraceae bacterium]